MATRKHPVELALNFFSAGVLLIHPKDIGELDDPAHPQADLAKDCHIYLIAKRPRLTFVPGSIHIGPDKTSGRFRLVKHGVPTEVDFWLEGYPNADSVEIDGYPHTRLLLVKDGSAIITLPAHTLSFLCDHVSDATIRDLEVVYTGMSYGDGSRSAKDRLSSHSTLQQVLAELNGEDPDAEALLLMVEYKPPMVILSIDGRTKFPDSVPERNVGADFMRTEQSITEDLRIALIEAGLIRYFQPHYNDKYKNRFPSPTHKILEEVYAIDFGALIVELNTEDINVRLFSATRPAGFHHLASVDLHDPAVRASFFNIMNVPAGPDATDNSGPVF